MIYMKSFIFKNSKYVYGHNVKSDASNKVLGIDGLAPPRIKSELSNLNFNSVGYQISMCNFLFLVDHLDRKVRRELYMSYTKLHIPVRYTDMLQAKATIAALSATSVVRWTSTA